MTATEAAPIGAIGRACGARRTPAPHRRGPLRRRPRRSPAPAGSAWCAARTPTPASPASTRPTAAGDCPACAAVLTGADLRDAWAAPDAVRLAGHRGHEEPGALPRRHRQGLLRRRHRRRRGGRLAATRRATPSTPSSSTTTRSPRSSTSRTRCPTGSSSTTTSAPTRSYTWDADPRRRPRSTPPSPAPPTPSSERYVQQRLIPTAMEPRGVAVVPQPFGGEFTLYSATQIPHILKVMLAVTAGIPEQKLRVDRPGGRRRLRLEAQRVRRGAHRPRPGPAARRAGALDRGPQRERPSPPSRAGARSRTSSWPPTPTARSPPCGCSLLADMGAYLQLVTPGIPLLGAFLYHGVYDVPAYSLRRARRCSPP